MVIESGFGSSPPILLLAPACQRRQYRLLQARCLPTETLLDVLEDAPGFQLPVLQDVVPFDLLEPDTPMFLPAPVHPDRAAKAAPTSGVLVRGAVWR